jgi:hypothetical protein
MMARFNFYEAVIAMARFFRRFGSALIALVLPFGSLLVEGLLQRYSGIHYEAVRAIVSVVCIMLLVHSWFMQRKYCQGRADLVFWTLWIAIPICGATWLGLNTLRASWYPLYWSDEEALRYERVCMIQDWTVWSAKVLAVMAICWALLLAMRWLMRRPSKPTADPSVR